MKKSFLLCSAACAVMSVLPLSAQGNEELDGKIGAIEETLAGVSSDVSSLKKLKISGYVQMQYQMADTLGNNKYDIGKFSGGSFSEGIDNVFSVRRGRIKAQYTADMASFVLQLDATQKGLDIKDAYMAITEPWLRNVTLTAGIFARPFGFEIGYSSSKRETPERSRLFQTLFPGERDLGAQLGLAFQEEESALQYFNLNVGVFNGMRGTLSENDNNKDIIGRLGIELPFSDAGLAIDAGASMYMGKVTSKSPISYAVGTQDGIKTFIADSSAATLNKSFDRTYVGADLQIYYDLPVLGGLSLRGEFITGTQPSTLGSSSFYATTDPIFSERKVSGFYVNYVQNVGSSNQLVVKYDVFDPNTDIEGSDIGKKGTSGATTAAFNKNDIKYSTLGLGWIYHWNGNVKFTAYYELVKNEEVNSAATGSLAPFTKDVKDNVFTFRAQYKF